MTDPYIREKKILMSQKTAQVKFTDRELEYLMENRLGRLATVSPEMQPHVVPLAYEFDGTYLYFSGWNLKNTLKFHNIQRNNKVAFAIDDLASVDPWLPRGIEIRGIAELVEKERYPYVRITPLRKISWGLEE